MLLLAIYPNQSTFLHQIVLRTPEIDKSKYTTQLRSLLEPSVEFIDKEVTGKKDEVQIQVPILPNLQEKSPFQLINSADLLALSDVMQEYV